MRLSGYLFRALGLSAVLLGVEQSTAQPPKANATTAPGEPVNNSRQGALLYNFIDQEPTDQLVEACALSPEQAKHIRQCYETYVAKSLALAAKSHERIDKDGFKAEVARLGKDAPAELVLQVDRAVNAQKEAIKGDNLAIEAAYLTCMTTLISEAQLPIFRRTLLGAQRQSWVDPGPMQRQDFFQFTDPIAILLIERPALTEQPEQLAAFDEFIALSETDLATRLATLWCAYEDARLGYRVARADVNANERTAFKRSVNTWNAIHTTLDQVARNGAAILEGAGQADAARRVRETYWTACFPDLAGNEITPTLFVVLEARQADLAPETQEAVRALRLQYLEQRHVLFRDAVDGHVRDYLRVADAEQRRRNLYLNSLGASSKSVTEALLARQRLGVRTQQSLSSLVGPLDSLLASPAVLQRKSIDTIVFETPHIEEALNEMLRQYEESNDAGTPADGN